MAGYRDLTEFFDPALRLPIGGKDYAIQPLNAEDGLRLRTLFADPANSMDDAEELEWVMKLFGAVWVPNLVDVQLYDVTTGKPMVENGKPVLVQKDQGHWTGGVWEQMRADGVNDRAVMHAGRTAMIHFGSSSTLAEIYWHTGVGDIAGNPLPEAPEAPAPNRQARRAKAKPKPTKTPAKRTPAKGDPAKAARVRATKPKPPTK